MKKILTIIFLVIISLNLNANNLENFDIRKISKPEIEVIEYYFKIPLYLHYIDVEKYSEEEQEVNDKIPEKRKWWKKLNIFKKYERDKR